MLGQKRSLSLEVVMSEIGVECVSSSLAVLVLVFFILSWSHGADQQEFCAWLRIEAFAC